MYCDRCGAAGKTRYVLNNGFDLVFCGHHAREYEPKLVDVAVEDVEYDGEVPTLIGV